MYTEKDDRLPPISASDWTPQQRAMAQPHH